MKRVLIDENLPIDLIGLSKSGNGVHATSLGDRLTDLELWNHARKHDMILLSKDTDFFDQMLLNGPPPQVVWIRWGNLRRKELETMLENQWPKVMTALTKADLVELHPGGRIETFRFS